MPACRQCGRENPEGTVFCGFCAAPLGAAGDEAESPQTTPGSDPSSAPKQRSSLQPKPSKPEIRTPIIRTSTQTSSVEGKGGFELIPWSQLSATQRAGRAIAALVVLFLIFFVLRGLLRGIGGVRGTSESAPSANSSDAPITQGDRKDGIESLCKVFQIYGLPKNDHDASEAARNAGELFKLAGNQPPERSAFILTSIVGEFRGGKLGSTDCTQAGAPLPTTEESNDSSTPPDVQR